MNPDIERLNHLFVAGDTAGLMDALLETSLTGECSGHRLSKTGDAEALAYLERLETIPSSRIDDLIRLLQLKDADGETIGLLMARSRNSAVNARLINLLKIISRINADAVISILGESSSVTGFTIIHRIASRLDSEATRACLALLSSLAEKTLMDALLETSLTGECSGHRLSKTGDAEALAYLERLETIPSSRIDDLIRLLQLKDADGETIGLLMARSRNSAVNARLINLLKIISRINADAVISILGESSSVTGFTIIHRIASRLDSEATRACLALLSSLAEKTEYAASVIKILKTKNQHAETAGHWISFKGEAKATQDYLALLSFLAQIPGLAASVIEILKAQSLTKDTVGHVIGNDSNSDSNCLYIMLLFQLLEITKDTNTVFELLMHRNRLGNNYATFLTQSKPEATKQYLILLQELPIENQAKLFNNKNQHGYTFWGEIFGYNPDIATDLFVNFMLSKSYPDLDLGFMLTESFKEKYPKLKDDIISHLRSAPIFSSDKHIILNRILHDKEDALYQLFHSKRAALEPSETRTSSALGKARILFDELNTVSLTATRKAISSEISSEASAGAGAVAADTLPLSTPADSSATSLKVSVVARTPAGAAAPAGWVGFFSLASYRQPAAIVAYTGAKRAVVAGTGTTSTDGINHASRAIGDSRL